MPTQEEVIKEITSNVCTIHNTPPFIGNVSNIIPVLTCCQNFKEQLQRELSAKFGQAYVEQTIRLT
jgi:hypothetical protein